MSVSQENKHENIKSALSPTVDLQYDYVKQSQANHNIFGYIICYWYPSYKQYNFLQSWNV